MTDTHPLLDRLVTHFGYLPLDTDNLDAFCNGAGCAALLCSGDPARFPECLDLAVVLPEILRAFPGRLRAGVAAPALEHVVQTRFGFARWPTLVLLRDGGYLGAISGIRDWAFYLARIAELLDGPAVAPPTLGDSVSVPSVRAACH